jgi:hypothetical protein
MGDTYNFDAQGARSCGESKEIELGWTVPRTLGWRDAYRNLSCSALKCHIGAYLHACSLLWRGDSQRWENSRIEICDR